MARFPQPGAYLSVGKRVTLYNAAMAACDTLDGVADGLISNQQQCNAQFDPTTATLNGVPLRCANGADTDDNCLSDAQIGALETINTPTNFGFSLASGETQYPGYNVWGADLGISSRTSAVQPVVTFLAFGSSQPANPMPVTAPYISVLTDQWFKYSVTRDTNFDSLSLDSVLDEIDVHTHNALSRNFQEATALAQDKLEERMTVPWTNLTAGTLTDQSPTVYQTNYQRATTTVFSTEVTLRTPLPTAARMRGSAPNTSFPTGMAVPLTVSIGQLSSTPAANPLKSTRPQCTRRASSGLARRYTVPIASQGTFTTAPSR